MKISLHLKYFILSCFVLLILNTVSAQDNKQKATNGDQYQCSPCGQDCDKQLYSATGECPHCHMQLVKKSTVTFKNISPGEICDYIKEHPAVVLLDVRTKEEFEGKAEQNFGTLKNAVNIKVQELESRLAGINDLKNKEIIVYCSHGHRSERASYLLTQNGFGKVINMTGGMSVMKDKACMK